MSQTIREDLHANLQLSPVKSNELEDKQVKSTAGNTDS